jgi:acyl-CoA synthetase (AMP-forming)/AMP-acid ligase II
LHAEIAARSEQLSHLGVTPGSRVLLMHRKGLDFFGDLLAVWSVGAYAACIDPETPPTQIDNICDFSQISLILVDADQSIDLVSPPRVVTLADTGNGASGKKSAVSKLPAELKNGGLILYTSGSTGSPKGVVLGPECLARRINANLAQIEIGSTWNVLCPLPYHFGHGLIGNCLTFLIAGCHLVLWPSPDASSLSELGSVINSQHIDFMSSVPSLWKVALKMSPEPVRNQLKRVHVGSAPLSKGLWADIIRWSGTQEVLNMYGMTETANWIGGASARQYTIEDGLVGRLWDGSAGVRSRTGDIMSSGDGEICLKTSAMMTGYLNRPDLTSMAVSDGWFNTGDVGNLTEDGVIILRGRRKFEINRGGLKIQPEDVDRVLSGHYMVKDAVTFGIPDHISGELVGVAVAPHAEFNPTVLELKDWCRKWLTEQKIPQRWFEFQEIPKNSRGKVDRSKIIELCLEGSVPRMQASNKRKSDI